MALLSSELDKIIRQNIKNESAYQAVLDVIARSQAPADTQTQYLKHLHQLSTAKYATLEEMFQAYLRVGCDVLGIRQGVVSHVSDETYFIQTTNPPASREFAGIPIEDVICNNVVNQEQTVVFRNMSTMDPSPRPNNKYYKKTECYIGTPLYSNNTLWGTICFYDSQMRSIDHSELDIEFIELMAQGISHALDEYSNRRRRQSAEERYHLIFENINTPVILSDIETYEILDVNSSAVEFYGYSREEFRNLSIVDINMLPPEDIESKIAEAKMSGRPYIRFPHRLKSGEIREIEAYLSDIAVDDQNIRSEIVYDYSDRHEAEEALKHSEANLRAIFDNASQLMFLVDDTAKIVAMNRSASIMTQLMGGGDSRDDKTLHNRMQVSDRYLVSDYIQRALRGHSISHESLVTLTNGNAVYIAYRYVPVKTADEQIIGVCVTGQDVTSLKLSQQELAHERNILRTLIDTLPDAIYIKDGDANILTANQRYLELARVDSTDEVLGKSDLELYADFGERYYQDDLAVIQTGATIVNKDDPVVLPDSSIGLLSTTKIPLRNADDTIIGLVGVGRDITVQREIENALRRRDEILNTISEAAQGFLKDTNWRDSIEGVLANLGGVLGVDRVYLFQNVETEAGLGASPIYEWTKGGVRNHRDYLKSDVGEWLLSRWVDALPNGELIAGQLSEMPSDEQRALTQRDIQSIAVVPVMVGSMWWGFMGFDMVQGERAWYGPELDVLMTAASTLGAAIQREHIEQGLRDNEQKFTQLITHIPETFWIYDLEAEKMVYVSENYEQMFGVSVADREADVNLFLAQVHSDDQPLVIDSLARQKRGEGNHYEARFIDDEREIRWVSVRIYPIQDEDGSVYRVAGVASDITEQKQAETNRLEVLAQRERINILANFFRDASHEFKTPLSIINTSLYILGKADTYEVRQQHHQRIHEQVQGISELVETLVLMSRLDSRTDLTLTPVNINSIMRQVANMTRNSYPDRADDIRLSIDETLPPIVGHLNYITQAVKNLVDNALRYSTAGNPIELRTRHDGEYVTIDIEDNGTGIPDDVLPEIFKRFYRGDEAHSTRGFGLGLPIALRIVQRHGGEIVVQTQVNQGSTFSLLFPMVDVVHD